MKKRLLAFIICAVMLGCAACGSGNSSGGQAASAEEENKEEIALLAEESRGAYESFLQNNEKVYTDKSEIASYDLPELGYESYYGAEEGFTLEELLALVNQVEDAFYDKSEVESVSYCYLDCGNDGVPELGLHVIFNMNTDILAREYIIKYIDGKLEVCYQLQSYYRDFNEITNICGCTSGFGFVSAAVTENREGFVDENGDYRVVCNELVSYFDTHQLDERFNEAILDNLENMPSSTVLYCYHFDNEADEYLYCAEESEDGESSGVDFDANTFFFGKVFEAAGVKLYTRDEINGLIQDRREEVGCTQEILDSESPEWIEMNVDRNKIDGIQEVVVSDVDELMEAIGNKTTILLKPGLYNVTDWLEKKIEKGEIEWLDSSGENDDADTDTSAPVIGYNGFENEPNLVISGIQSCRLMSADEDNPAIIESIASGADVMSLEDCAEIEFVNLSLRHVDRGDISCGSIINAYNCDHVLLEKCDLTGSEDGAVSVSNGYGFKVTDSTIHSCGTEYETTDGYVSFENCVFQDMNQSHGLVSGRDVTFYECTIE